jgi:hypothetical protein
MRLPHEVVDCVAHFACGQGLSPAGALVAELSRYCAEMLHARSTRNGVVRNSASRPLLRMYRCSRGCAYPQRWDLYFVGGSGAPFLMDTCYAPGACRHQN